MSERSWTTVDKSAWGEGAWTGEPDKVQWVDEATDLDCLVVRNRMGAWCGYVGVPPGHPAHGVPYDDVNVDVHGGLTFADRCNDDAREGYGICHVPAEGRPADVWWLGFDCNHAGDLAPLTLKYAADLPHMKDDVYRDLGYAKRETARLAEQLAGIATRRTRV